MIRASNGGQGNDPLGRRTRRTASPDSPEVRIGDPNPVSREFAREWHFNGLTYQPSGPVGVAPSIAGARRRNPGLMSRQGQAEVRRPVNAVISA